MANKITCLVTLHGVGFQQPPDPNVPDSGYADQLHEHLSKCLGNKLCDDPYRRRGFLQRGLNGAIYVESLCHNDEKNINSREEGLKRLGKWCSDKVDIDTTGADLLPKNAVDGSIAHVALVYSNLEPHGPEVGAAAMTLGMSLFSSPHYGNVSDLFHMALTDGLALIGHHASNGQDPSSFRPRNDFYSRPAGRPGQLSQVVHETQTGLLTTLRFIADDVACYICQNEERERVRSFVAEALLRLAARDDVESIVFNTHSNGTVIAFDVLRHLPVKVTNKIKAFVTAGSPLRKYVDLFHWGNQIAYLYPVKPWYNFWDPRDPVADPLNPPIYWHVGNKIPVSEEKLFGRIDPDSEKFDWIEVDDRKVNNVDNTQGDGLRAHNYWDNTPEFVQPLASILGQIADGQRSGRSYDGTGGSPAPVESKGLI